MKKYLVFLFFLVANHNIAQSKREKIEQLNFSLDSLRVILNEERGINSVTQQKMNNNLERVIKEKAELEKQYSLKEKQYSTQNQDLDKQLKNCKKQIDSLQSLLKQPMDNPESYLFYLKNDYLTDYIKGELNTPEITTLSVGSKNFIITHTHDAGNHVVIYWEVKKTTLYPKYNFEYGSPNWDAELHYILLNYVTNHEESGIIKGTNGDLLLKKIEQKIEKFIITGK